MWIYEVPSTDRSDAYGKGDMMVADRKIHTCDYEKGKYHCRCCGFGYDVKSKGKYCSVCNAVIRKERFLARLDILRALSHKKLISNKIKENKYCLDVNANWHLWEGMVRELRTKFRIEDVI